MSKKCETCYGFGLWAMGDPAPMGPMDASDGCPTKECPECGANGIPKDCWKTLEGEYIPIKKLTDKHLENIIKHIKERDPYKDEILLLSKMINEQKRRIK